MLNFYNNLETTLFDNVFIFGISTAFVYLIATIASYLTFGGLILILGAWFVFKGEIFVATFAYLTADAMWIINAYQLGDMQGALFISVGMALGIGATYKMQIGKFAKNIKL